MVINNASINCFLYFYSNLFMQFTYCITTNLLIKKIHAFHEIFNAILKKKNISNFNYST